MKQTSSKNTFFGGAAILMVGIAVVKLIGALYKIPVANLLGDEGNGHFNNAYVIYNLLLMVSTAGLPVALSKTIAEADALGWRNQIDRILKVAFVAFIILGLITAVVMYQFALPLATLQGNSAASTAVRALAPACFFVCVLSTFRGYAQGHSNMVPTSISQVIEAAGKLIVGVGLTIYFLQIGAEKQVAAAGAIFGVTAGAGIAMVYMVMDYRRRQKHFPTATSHDKPDSSKQILKRLLLIAIPITLGAAVVPLTTWIDTFQVQNILRDVMGAKTADYYELVGVTDPVVSAYGAYQKSVTVFNLPSSLMVAITACVIPFVSACWAKRDMLGVKRLTESSLRIGSMIAFPAGIGIAVLASPIIRLLFSVTDHAVADPSLVILGIASIFVSLMFLCNAILQASGFVNLPIIIMIIGCVLKLIVNNFLVRQEAIGIVGAPVGTLVCYTVVTVLELIIIRRVLPNPPSYMRSFGKPLVSALFMGAGAWGTFGLLQKLLLSIGPFRAEVEEVVQLTTLGNMVATIGAILVGVAIYVILIIVLKAVTREDLSLMPKGDKIAKILRIRD